MQVSNDHRDTHRGRFNGFGGMVTAQATAVNASGSQPAHQTSSGIPKASASLERSSGSGACARYEEVSWQMQVLQALRNPSSTTMTPEEIRDLLVGMGKPPETIEFVLTCVKNAPIRKMKGYGGSGRHEVYSQKMGRTHTFESRTVELPFGMFLERDPDVLAYYPQPCEMPLVIGTGVGSTRMVHTPDALVITRTEICFEEWKSEEAYNSLHETKPRRYQRIDGYLHDPAAEQYAAAHGIAYRIRSRQDLPEIFVENMEYLDDYKVEGAEPLSDAHRGKIQAVLSSNPSLTLAEALRAETSLSIDHWLKAIADGVVTADLSGDRLAIQANAFVYRDPVIMQFAKAERKAAMKRLAGTQALRFIDGMSFILDGKWFQLTTAGETNAFLKNEDDASIEIPLQTLEAAFKSGKLTIESVPEIDSETQEASQRLREANLAELEAAQAKLAAVRAPKSRPDVSPRTLRYWTLLVKNAEARNDEPLIALLPRRSHQGNRDPRVEEGHLDFIHRVIKRDYFQLHRPSKSCAYDRYKLKLARMSRLYRTRVWTPVSRQTYGAEIARMSDTGANYNRFGKRIGAAMRPTYVAKAYETSVHGVRPFHVVHVDHTQSDIEVISKHDGQPLGRPWLTVVSDADRRYVLAWSLSLRSPDAATTLGVLRDMAARHGRLPSILVIDNGPDLRSGLRRRIKVIHFGCYCDEEGKVDNSQDPYRNAVLTLGKRLELDNKQLDKLLPALKERTVGCIGTMVDVFKDAVAEGMSTDGTFDYEAIRRNLPPPSYARDVAREVLEAEQLLPDLMSDFE